MKNNHAIAPLSPAQRQQLDQEAAELHKQLRMDKVSLEYLVEKTVTTYDPALADLVLKDRKNPLALHKNGVESASQADGSLAIELLDRVKCKNLKQVVTRVAQYTIISEKFFKKAVRQPMVTDDPVEERGWLYPIVLFNLENPGNTITMRSMTRGTFHSQSKLEHLIKWVGFSSYRKGRKIIRNLPKEAGPNWKDEFVAYEKGARRTNYYLLRHRRAEQKIQQFAAVGEAISRYNVRTIRRKEQLTPKNLLPCLQKSVCDLLEDVSFFHKVTAAWPQELVKKAKVLTQRIGAAEHRMKGIYKDLKPQPR